VKRGETHAHEEGRKYAPHLRNKIARGQAVTAGHNRTVHHAVIYVYARRLRLLDLITYALLPLPARYLGCLLMPVA